MKVLERNKAIVLRKQGKTFSEILEEIPVSKTSLSYWLRNINLTNQQLTRIRYKNDKIKEKFIKFNELRKKRAEDSKNTLISGAFEEIDILSERELKLIGVALYWAEGYTKDSNWKAANFTNSSPEMIKIMMKWFRIICKVREERFRIRIQCYDLDKIQKIEEFWSTVTGIPQTQFIKPYIKVSCSSQKKMGNISPYGVCSIRISDVALLNKIKGWIRGFMALSSSLA